MTNICIELENFNTEGKHLIWRFLAFWESWGISNAFKKVMKTMASSPRKKITYTHVFA
jgi:hypothetical protein